MKDYLLKKTNYIPTIILLIILMTSFLLLNDVNLPIISNIKFLFVLFLGLGLGMCITGSEIKVEKNKVPDKNFFTALGAVGGVLSLCLIIAVLFGVKLPLATTDKEAILAFSFLSVILWVSARIHHFIDWKKINFLRI